MNQKRLNILLITFFAWNALFGAVGGLLICIHDDLQMHADVGQKNEADCETAHVVSDSSHPSFDAKETCVDFDVDASLAAFVRPEYSDDDQWFNPYLLAHESNVDSSLTLRELAPDLQAQAPPELTAVSVHTVQLTQLRI